MRPSVSLRFEGQVSNKQSRSGRVSSSESYKRLPVCPQDKMGVTSIQRTEYHICITFNYSVTFPHGRFIRMKTAGRQSCTCRCFKQVRENVSVPRKSWRRATLEENLLYKVLGLEMWVFLQNLYFKFPAVGKCTRSACNIFPCLHKESTEPTVWRRILGTKSHELSHKPWISKTSFLKNCIKDEPCRL